MTARKSPATQATYLGVDNRFADGWLTATVSRSQTRARSISTRDRDLEHLEARAAPSTVKKDRASACRALARYLHQLRVINATEILMVETPTTDDRLAVARQGLDVQTWGRVVTVARPGSTPTARQRGSPAAAARDLAFVQVLGGAGLRLRGGLADAPPSDPFTGGRTTTAATVYLRVEGKGPQGPDRPCVC